MTTNLEECAPCPVFASFILAFALKLRKEHVKMSVMVIKTSVSVREKRQDKKNLSHDKETSVRLRKHQ